MKVHDVNKWFPVILVGERTRDAQKSYIAKNPVVYCGQKVGNYFYTSAPRNGVHGMSDPLTFYFTVEHLNLDPNLAFADLGSGFGGIGYAGGVFFETSTNFELDPQLYDESVKLSEELNFGHNVSFMNMDFMDPEQVDLSYFDVMFIFEPFWQDHVNELALRMSQVKSGAVVISRLAPSAAEKIFPPSVFEKLSTHTTMMLYDAYRKR